MQRIVNLEQRMKLKQVQGEVKVRQGGGEERRIVVKGWNMARTP